MLSEKQIKDLVVFGFVWEAGAVTQHPITGGAAASTLKGQ